MANGDQAVPYSNREVNRQEQLKRVWSEQLDDVFADIAPYYDRANTVASLGLLNWFLRQFIGAMDVQSGDKVLDVCAGTNIIGISLLKKQPDLQIHAIDRSEAMQAVGQKQAQTLGMHIESTIGDVHSLPFPDNHFDAVTLQYATRHLRVLEVTSEIRRVLKPGGYFYHCDMLRPANKFVECCYYTYLRCCLNFTGLLFRSSKTAYDLREYFIDALQLFYTPEEFTDMLRNQGLSNISCRTVMGGMLAYHKAMKPLES